MNQVLTIPDAKWSCKGCGSCCQGFSFGPVEADVVSRLEDKKITEHWRSAEKQWRVRHPQTGDWYFTHVDGHCVFLRPDKLCAIHAIFGEDHKPWFCREYPFNVVAEPRGFSVQVREDCGGFHQSFLDGESVSSQAEAILELPRIVPRQEMGQGSVLVLPGMAVSPKNWVQVEPSLLDIMKRESDPRNAVSEVREALFRMAGRSLASQKDEHSAFCVSFLVKLRDTIQENHCPESLIEQRSKILSLLNRAIENTNPGLPALNEASSAYFNLILRGRTLAKRFLALGGLPQGLGFFLVEYQLLLRGVGSSDLNDVGPAMASWRRGIMLPPFWSSLRSNSVHLVDVFMSA